MGICCSKNRTPIYVITFREILELNKLKIKEILYPTKIDFQALEEIIHEKLKPLIEYLEINTRKLKWISNKLRTLLNNNKTNAVTHIIILTIYKEISSNITKFKFDPSITKKLLKRKKRFKRLRIKFNNAIIEKYFINSLNYFENKFILSYSYLIKYYDANNDNNKYSNEIKIEITNMLFKCLIIIYNNNIAIMKKKIGSQIIFLLINFIDKNIFNENIKFLNKDKIVNTMNYILNIANCVDFIVLNSLIDILIKLIVLNIDKIQSLFNNTALGNLLYNLLLINRK